ncbi:DUF1761 family protein [Paenisporosarcina cavernae]|uniref:DUF1761 family protein n=1 Tax=Paenisporosarcina cavernae TaxID=2320858 RepID=A0A385YPG3_9BACL|nr:DUF1761 family protein [Paenisporosarcina cavernae]AYC28595.1 DUF1761 family protein [Paenisporosarcina cavernae]
MDIMSLNWLAILVGAIAYALFGVIYYSVQQKKKETETKAATNYLVALSVALVVSVLVQGILQKTGTITWESGLVVGLSIGIIVSLVYVKNYVFGLLTKSVFYLVIWDHIIAITLVGFVQGLIG